jgi:hypothetical protein
MNADPAGGTRTQPDRRARPTAARDAFRHGGRRVWPRRHKDRAGSFFLDRFDALTLAMVVSLLCLTIVDGVLTIELLDLSAEEANPFMRHLLTRSHFLFLVGKYALTAAGLPFIVVFKHYPLFGTRFRAGWLLHVFIGLYLLLLIYQWTHLNSWQLSHV